MPNIDQRAQEFILKGNTDTALLFIHGFTASPSEVYPAAEIIHKETEFTVKGVLLPGHGSTPAELNRTPWQDWYAAVMGDARELRREYGRVFLAGLSMGGLLAIYTGIHLTGIKGVISINAPVFTRHRLLTSMAPVIRLFTPYFPKFKKDQEKLEKMGRFAYRCYPVSGFEKLKQLSRIVEQELNKLEVPLLVIQSRKDKAVNPISGEYLRDNAVKSHSALIKLDESGHIATMTDEKDLVAANIIKFMQVN